MKKFLKLLAAAIFITTIFASCQNETTDVVSRLSTTAVSNLRATAYEGAIVLTWNYKADSTGGFIVTRTADGVEKQIATSTTFKVGENSYVDCYGDSNQLVDGKSYKYTVYTTPSTSSAFVEKAASASASAKAIIKTPTNALSAWDIKDVTSTVETLDGKTYVVVTRPASYAYTYSAILTINYQAYDSYTGKTILDSQTMTKPTISGIDSTRKEGKDGIAKDYYLIKKGDSWTNVRYTLSATKSLGGTASQLGFYKDSYEMIYGTGSLSGYTYY